MSMIIESLPLERRVSRSSDLGGRYRRPSVLRGSALVCRTGWLVPAKVAGLFARYRVQRARSIAGALEGFERFATHRGVDVEVRHAGNGTKLLEHEEDDAVVHQATPVASTNQASLFFGQPGSLETCFRIAKERLAMTRLPHPGAGGVCVVRLHAA